MTRAGAVSGDHRLVGERHQRVVGRVAPPERTELLAGELQHTGVPVGRVQGVGRISHVSGGSWSRSIAGSTSERFHSAGRLATTTAASSAVAATVAIRPTGSGRRTVGPAAAVTRAPAPSPTPSSNNGTARVLLRNARATPPSSSPTSTFISGDEFSMGATPTASTTPTPMLIAAKRRCGHEVDRQTGEPDDDHDVAESDRSQTDEMIERRRRRRAMGSRW